MNKRGFTLMEVLAVVLLLAVIASLAVPGIRSARYEMKNSQAKAAAKKLLEGIKSYRQASRGAAVTFPATGFTGDFSTSCTAAVNTGIPGTSIGLTVKQLAACGFISPKDFKGLPYKFYYGTLPTIASSITDKQGSIVMVVLGTDQAGPTYKNNNKYAIYIDDRLEPLEYEAD